MQSNESSVHIPCSQEKKKSKYWSLNHQQLTEPNPCIKRQLTQNKKKSYALQPHHLLIFLEATCIDWEFFWSELENLRLEGFV